MTEEKYYEQKHDLIRDLENQYHFRPDWTIAFEIHELTEAVQSLEQTIKVEGEELRRQINYLR